MFALAAIVAGSIVGALHLGYFVILFSRVVEGIGLVILSVIGPAAVSTVFTNKSKGAAMGLLMSFMNFGQIAMLNLAPRIAMNGSWTSVWWVTAVYGAVFLVLWCFTMGGLDATLVSESTPAKGTEGKGQSLLPREVFLNKNVWLVGLATMLYLIAEQGVISFLPTYMTEVRGFDATTAGSMISVAPIIGIPVAILTGIISDKMNSRKKPLGFLLLCSAVIYALFPLVPSEMYMVMILVFGIAAMGIIGLCFSAAGDLVAPQYGGAVSAFANLFQWIGIFLSSTLFGMFRQALGWNIAFYIMVPISAIGALCVFAVKDLK